VLDCRHRNHASASEPNAVLTRMLNSLALNRFGSYAPARDYRDVGKTPAKMHSIYGMTLLSNLTRTQLNNHLTAPDPSPAEAEAAGSRLRGSSAEHHGDCHCLKKRK